MSPALTETANNWSHINVSSIGNLDSALSMLPISLHIPKGPGEHLLASTIEGLAGQLTLSIQTLLMFETRRIKTHIRPRASAPPSSVGRTSPPTQCHALVNEIQRRLCSLSAPIELQLSAAEASMISSSGALLARQTSDSATRFSTQISRGYLLSTPSAPCRTV